MDKDRGGEAQPGQPYVTLDGSMVTELVRPERGGSRNLSVAEAVIEPGQRALRHAHRESDEVYYVLGGKGEVSVGEKSFPVEPGSCLFSPAGEPHSAAAAGNGPLKILCACAPPYAHEDTIPVD